MESEKWENEAIVEIEFYKNRFEHLQKIDEHLIENEEKCYSFPIGYIDAETGEYKVSGGSVENQVAYKVDAEQALNKLRKRVLERCNRFDAAYQRLDEPEQELIDYVYLDDSPIPLSRQAHLLGYRTVKDFKKVEEKALNNLHRFLLLQKDQVKKEKKSVYEQEKMERVKQVQEAMSNGSLYKMELPKPKKTRTIISEGKFIEVEVS